MKISDAKALLSQIVVYNMEQAKVGKSHNTYIVPFFLGDPGIGKTAIPNQVAAELEILYKQVILAQFDAGELAGLPFVGKQQVELLGDDGKVYLEEHERMIRLRPTYLPDAERGEHVGIFNLDELPQAFLANQNIASQLVNEYRVGEHLIPEGFTICCTGNKPENKAGTTTMPTHLRDRLMFIEIEVDPEDWLAYAAQYGVDARVRTFIRQNPRHLSEFSPGANVCPSPRSWEKTSAILSMSLPSRIRTQAIHGTIGQGIGTAFEAWLRVEDRMPKIEDIIANPDAAPVFGNKDADVLYLLLASLADYANEKNVGAIIQYIKRLPNAEFSVVWAHDALKRNPKLSETKEITRWKMTDGARLMF